MTKALKEGPRRANTESGTDNPTRVERLQQDMLACLRKPGHDPISYAGLAYCGPQGCGRVGCSEACWYGNRRRLRSEIQAIHNLLSKTDQPLCEVRVVPGLWARPIGKLDEFDISAVKHLNARALNKLYMPSLVAVGNVKVAVAPSTHYQYGERLWACELHQIVELADEAELKAAFSRLREGGAFLNKIWMKRVEDLGECLAVFFGVISCDGKNPDCSLGKQTRIQCAQERRNGPSFTGGCWVYVLGDVQFGTVATNISTS
jgi:hypothetical protein